MRRAEGFATAAVVAGWLGIGWLGSTIANPILFVSFYLLAFAGFGFAAYSIHRLGWHPSWKLIVGVTLLVRVAALAVEPSDDMHRYLWEAKVLQAGHSPYESAPDSEELAALRAEFPPFDQINHRSWTAIYPPLGQYWNAAFARGPWPQASLRLSFVAAELLAMGFLVALLAARGIRRDRLLLYAWNPLPVWAFVAESHIDAVAVLLLVAALWLVSTSRAHAAVAALTGAVLVKWLAIAALPAFLLRASWKAWVWSVFVASACLWPFRDNVMSVFDSLTRFGTDMQYNDSGHELIATLLPALGWTDQTASRFTVLAMGALCAVWAMRTMGSDAVRSSAWLLGAMLLLMPTVHPWYLAHMAPFLAVIPWTGWIALSGSAVLVQLAQIEIAQTGQWTEWHALKWIAYSPLYVWLLWCVARRVRVMGEVVSFDRVRGVGRSA